MREELFKDHGTYNDLKSSEMRMEYLRVLKDETKFRESLDYMDKEGKFIAKNF